MNGSAAQSELPRSLGLLDALSIVIGIVIGGGIFIVPNLVARELRSASLILAVWALAGILSFFGTLALYCSYFFPLSPLRSKLLGLAAITLFTLINYRGVILGAAVQKLFTLAKVLGLLIIIGGAFYWHGKAVDSAAGSSSAVSFSSFGVALIACMLAYDGWIQMSFVAGEIRNPQRNIFLALALGTAACIVVYLLANLAYMRVLPISEIAVSNHIGASVAERVFGSSGGGAVALTIMVSIIGTLNGCFLTSPRLYFAQARDGLFLRKFGEIQPRFQTPGFAIIAQGLWAGVLLLSGSYESLLDYSMFALWLSYGVMIAGLILLRRTRPDALRPYKMWGYPVTALLFVAFTAWFLVNMLVKRPIPSLAGLLLIASGVPAYFISRRRQHAASTAECAADT